MSATSFAGLWADVQAEAKKLWAAAGAELKAFEAAFVPAAEQDLAAAGSALYKLAVNMAWTLATQEFANLTGGQKNAITVTSIKQAAITAGTPLVNGVAEKLAEDAYQALKTTAPSLTPGS
ncbi:MAG TPA: hypothetical protein VG892_07760 [Terriglobales bacterium]|nr:hypothetical protein [Terriglobales bacterium]